MRSSSVCFTLFALSTTLAAQQASVSGVPAMGYALDPSARALRPIWGIPRAASAGEPIEAGFAIQSAVISSSGSYGLAIAGDGTLRLLTLSGPFSNVDVPVVGRAQALVRSPRGTAAAVLAENWIGFMSGFSAGSSQVAGVPINTAPVQVSVSDDGAYLIAALPDGSLEMFGRDGTQVPLSAPAPISMVAFRPGDTDALALSVDNRVWLIHQTSFAQIAGPGDGVSSSVGLGFLPDGNTALIAGSSGTILTINVQSGAKSPVVCACAPSRLEPMAASGVFRLTSSWTEPQYMFDGASLQSFFVPAVPANNVHRRRPED
ncbi:MAG TPA: WD40 repeat domain-containing protein [Bryobacteraceae bacterium]